MRSFASLYVQVMNLFPSAEGLELIWSSVVKIAQSLYREAPGMDPYRPDQRTPVPNFYLAGSYTKQVRGHMCTVLHSTTGTSVLLHWTLKEPRGRPCPTSTSQALTPSRCAAPLVCPGCTASNKDLGPMLCCSSSCLRTVR